MCDRLGITQENPPSPQGRWDLVYWTIFLGPRFVYGARVVSIEDALANPVKEALAVGSSQLCSAELLAGYAEPTKQGPDCSAGDGGVERIPVIGTNAG